MTIKTYELTLNDLSKELALERFRINILKNQIDYILKEMNKSKQIQEKGREMK